MLKYIAFSILCCSALAAYADGAFDGVILQNSVFNSKFYRNINHFTAFDTASGKMILEAEPGATLHGPLKIYSTDGSVLLNLPPDQTISVYPIEEDPK